jgi:hypothetical protein
MIESVQEVRGQWREGRGEGYGRRGGIASSVNIKSEGEESKLVQFGVNLNIVWLHSGCSALS